MKTTLNRIALSVATVMATSVNALAQDAVLDVQHPRTLGHALLNSVIFALLGMILVFIAFKVFDKATPKVDFQQELVKNNTAVAIVIAAVVIGISLIVAASIMG
jgi:uncharacterized membrane protein YjfL (UPF0719 family)